jgi:hypothetical protein
VTLDRRPPLVLDDPFVTFDEARADQAMRLLRDVAAEDDFQVLYLTCSDRYDSHADRLVVLDGPAGAGAVVDAAAESDRGAAGLGDDPEPGEPGAGEAEPTDPDPADPGLTDPDPADPGLTDPDPADPGLTDPDPADPVPADPAVGEVAVEAPAPGDHEGDGTA